MISLQVRTSLWIHQVKTVAVHGARQEGKDGLMQKEHPVSDF